MLVGVLQPDNRIKGPWLFFRLISTRRPGGRSDPALGLPANCFLPTLGSGGGGGRGRGTECLSLLGLGVAGCHFLSQCDLEISPALKEMSLLTCRAPPILVSSLVF